MSNGYPGLAKAESKPFASPQFFFVREEEILKVLSFGTTIDSSAVIYSIPSPKAAVWSPNGKALAASDAAGVQVVEFGFDQEDIVSHQLDGSPKTVQRIFWSPLSSTLVTICTLPQEGSEPNVHVWRKEVGGAESYLLTFSFVHHKHDARDHKLLQWSDNEIFCARLCPDGMVHILDGTNLGAAPLATLRLKAESFAFAATGKDSSEAFLAVFVPDMRDSMSRVVGPAEVTIWKLTQDDAGKVEATRVCSTSVATGQHADLDWNAAGNGLLAHCQTEVDDSGRSYYGASKLLLMSKDGEYVEDLDITCQGCACVQAVAWNPACDEFILISGLQPATVTLWRWNAKARVTTLASTLLEKAHRNTIRFNHFGSIVCLAGFGNLAGEVNFFGRNGACNYLQLSSCVAHCTINAEWAPDGRHLMASVLAPRMRVDNGISVLSALSGAKLADVYFDKLLDTQWRPEHLDSARFRDISSADLTMVANDFRSKNAEAHEKKVKQAYRPPNARKGRGEDETVRWAMTGSLKGTDYDRSMPARPTSQPVEPEACPASGWECLDKKQNIHGPFTLVQMRQQHAAGRLPAILQMRCDPADRFIPLGELFPHPLVPFQSYPRRPKGTYQEDL